LILKNLELTILDKENDLEYFENVAKLFNYQGNYLRAIQFWNLSEDF
jgi:hypothetical protein